MMELMIKILIRYVFYVKYVLNIKLFYKRLIKTILFF